MKKLNLATFSVICILTAAACMHTIEYTDIPDADKSVGFSENVICFSTDDDRPATKTFSETTTESLKTTGFNAVVLSGSSAYVPQGTASWNGTKGVYLFSDTYYYPLSGTLDIYASQPNAMTVSGNTVTVSFAQSTAAYECDLIVAKNSVTMPKTGASALTFDHALAQVTTKFKAGDSNVKYYVKTCSLTSPASGTYAFATNAWTPGANESHQTYNNASGTIVATTGTYLGGTATCIPCSLKVTVSWECRDKVTDSFLASYSKSGTITITKGARNKVLLTLNNDAAAELQLSVTVNAWTDGTETEIDWDE